MIIMLSSLFYCLSLLHNNNMALAIFYLNKSWWCIPWRWNIYSGRSLVSNSLLGKDFFW